jgi:hypothetical protein
MSVSVRSVGVRAFCIWRLSGEGGHMGPPLRRQTRTHHATAINDERGVVPLLAMIPL